MAEGTAFAGSFWLFVVVIVVVAIVVVIFIVVFTSFFLDVCSIWETKFN